MWQDSLFSLFKNGMHAAQRTGERNRTIPGTALVLSYRPFTASVKTQEKGVNS